MWMRREVGFLHADRSVEGLSRTARAPTPYPGAPRHANEAAVLGLTGEIVEPLSKGTACSSSKRTGPSESSSSDKVRGMQVQVGDKIVVESEKVAQPSRAGVIEEVLREDPPSVRVRWEDGRTSILTPSAGAARVIPGKTRKTRKTRAKS